MKLQRAITVILVVIALAIVIGIRMNRGAESRGVSLPETEMQGQAEVFAPTPQAASSPATSESKPLSSKFRVVEKSATPAAPQVQVTKALRSEFLNLRQEVFQSIPSKAQLQNLSDEEAHYTPEAIVNASIEIGKMAQLIYDNPSLSADGLEFYKECAENKAYPNSTRASCYASFHKLAKKSGISATEPHVSKYVSQLAEKVM